MNYAQQTNVSVEKSRAEIEQILGRYGASKFGYMSEEDRAMVAFVAKGKMVRFTLPLPDKRDKRFWTSPRQRRQRTAEEAHREWEQACRSRWRSLSLCVKAKLEAVASGITTFEAEFLAHFVLPTGQTVGETTIPQLDAAMSGQPMRLQLTMGEEKRV